MSIITFHFLLSKWVSIQYKLLLLLLQVLLLVNTTWSKSWRQFIKKKKEKSREKEEKKRVEQIWRTTVNIFEYTLQDWLWDNSHLGQLLFVVNSSTYPLQTWPRWWFRSLHLHLHLFWHLPLILCSNCHLQFRELSTLLTRSALPNAKQNWLT